MRVPENDNYEEEQAGEAYVDAEEDEEGLARVHMQRGREEPVCLCGLEP